MTGGLAAALVSLPVSMTYGIVAFAPLGPGYVGAGLIAGIYGAVAICLISVLFGSRTMLASGPRAAAAIVFASVVAYVLDLDSVRAFGTRSDEIALAFGFLSILLAGFLQVLAGFLRIGTIVKYLPVPVIAGFVNGSSLIIALSQLPMLFGFSGETGLLEIVKSAPEAITVATLAGLLAIVAMKYGSRVTHKLPAPFIALLAGTLGYHALRWSVGDNAPAPMLNAVSSGAPHLYLIPEVFELISAGIFFESLGFVLTAAISMAALASFDTLLSLSALADRTGARSKPNRELMRQGAGNIAAPLLGGIMGSGGLNRTAPALAAGAKTAGVHVVSALIMLVAILLCYSAIQHIPQAVISGMIIFLGYSLLDRWSLGLLWSFRKREARRRELLLDAVIIVFVVSVALIGGLILAVGVGVALSAIFFVSSMSRSIVRGISHGPGIHSRQKWSPERQAALAEHAHRIAVVELEGVLFFGTSHNLEACIDELLKQGLSYIILDFKRVRDVDTSGARALQRMRERVDETGASLILSCILRERRKSNKPYAGSNARERADQRRVWVMLECTGSLERLGLENLFDTTDSALAHCEDRLIEEFRLIDQSLLVLRKSSIILRDLDRADLRALRNLVQREEFESDTVIFEQGAEGDSVYLIVEGDAHVYMDSTKTGTRSTRYSLRPGSIFGEMAVLDREPRAASVRSVGNLTCYRLKVSDFEVLKANHPGTALKIYNNLCVIFSERLRAANGLISELEG